MYPYRPDYMPPPGETLREVLEMRGMTQAELSRRTGRPKKLVNEIVQGETRLTPETALHFERVLGVPATFWNNLESNYQDFKERQREAERLEAAGDWCTEYPLAEMAKRGWIKRIKDRVEQTRELLGFFAVASPEQVGLQYATVGTLYKRSEKVSKKLPLITAWLRAGEIEADRLFEELSPAKYDADVFRESLAAARALTLEEPSEFVPKLQALCAKAGVLVAFVPEFPGMGIHGATRWIRNASVPLVQLTLRCKTDDMLWFSFFHEAGHILLHVREPFLEVDPDGRVERAEYEVQADAFAARQLIPDDQMEELRTLIPTEKFPSERSLREFASKIGVAPGIVVGRLHHDGLLPHTHLNKVKRTLRWDDLVTTRA